jgi:membrane protein DedA with SNARE-associated domain
MMIDVLAEDTGPPSGGMVGFVTDLMERLGGPGAGLAVALENLFPPIPSEVILPLAGFTASQGKMSLAGAILWTTLGSVVGALALYYVGALLGRDRVRAIAAKLPLVKLSDVDRTEAWFLRHGGKAVFFGRMIPIFRSLISIPAGVERMRVGVFLLYTTLGSLIWNTIFVMTGYLLGESWPLVEEYVGAFQNIVIVVCAVAVGYFVLSRIRQNRRERRDGGHRDADAGHQDAGFDARTVDPPGPWPGTGTSGGAGTDDRRARGTIYGTPRRPDPTR